MFRTLGADYGGAYLPEALVPAAEAVAAAFIEAWPDPAFRAEYADLLATYAGRPTPLTTCRRLSAELGVRVLLKREDLAHTGSHKINNVLGQALLARRMGRTRLIAETGAGQHGVATATAAALFGMGCTVYMGHTDIARQAPNVFRMELLGAELVPVGGRGTLKDAVNAALRAWVSEVDTTHYCACVGGGSNAAGTFAAFLDTPARLVGVEAAGGAALTNGRPGILHGFRSRFLQDDDGQIREAESISAGLDYPGVGPEHAMLADTGRARYTTATDAAALDAVHRLCRTEGILPALESAHALAWVLAAAGTDELPAGSTVLVTLSGRGDKDIDQIRAAS